MAFSADSFPWGEPAPDGSRYALLEGRRDVDGALFTYAFFIPAGFWDAAHWHSRDARVFVLSGALHLGYGDVLEPESATVFGAGAFVLVPAGARHFDGSDVDTVIVGVASGVWTTHYVDSGVRPSAGTVS
ncbi:MAG: hypothetical protein HC933_01240 [Pleurocapsa sp. SU_196_0]|nr:hypothetical protein [Pleurocapsa sp. SU_196_0]